MTEHQEEQAALYALHMLDLHETRILESEMRTDSRLRDCVGELEDTAGKIAFLIPEQAPPIECRRDLLSALKQKRRANIIAISAPLRVFRNPWLAWAAAAGFAIAAISLLNSNRGLADKVVTLSKSESDARIEAAHVTEQNMASGKQLAQVSSDLERVKSKLGNEIDSLKRASLVSRMEAVALRTTIKKYDEGVAIVIWDAEKQEGKLKLDKMLPVPSNKDYQLWVIDKKKPTAPVSAGVIKVDQHGIATVTFKPVEAVSDMTKFALSVEKQGGVPQKSPDGPIVFISQ